MTDLIAQVKAATGSGVAWSDSAEDLNVNLVVFDAGKGIDEHVNTEVDVLIVGIEGRGWIEIEGEACKIQAGMALIIPKGKRRAIRSDDDYFAYLTCHRRRSGLWPLEVRAADSAHSGDSGRAS